MNKTLLCDVDEVLLHWTNGFTNFLRNHKNMEVNRERDDHSVYKWLEIHPDEAYDLIFDFNSSHHFSLLEPFDCAHKVLPKLYDEGYTITAITSCSSNSVVANLRRENLHKYFGDIFEDIFCLDFHQNKGEVLSQYHNAIWVEDSIEWAVCGADLGHKTFLIDHTHNKSLVDPRITRVDDWHTLYNMISMLDDEYKISYNFQIS